MIALVSYRAVPVPNSVMPKGVEHLDAAAAASTRSSVPNSVMPKGVEHTTIRRSRDCAVGDVPNSVMPKGVEHACRSSPERQVAARVRIQ